MDCFKSISRDKIESNLCYETKQKNVYYIRTVTTTNNHVMLIICWD